MSHARRHRLEAEVETAELVSLSETRAQVIRVSGVMEVLLVLGTGQLRAALGNLLMQSDLMNTGGAFVLLHLATSSS